MVRILEFIFVNTSKIDTCNQIKLGRLHNVDRAEEYENTDYMHLNKPQLKSSESFFDGFHFIFAHRKGTVLMIYPQVSYKLAPLAISYYKCDHKWRSIQAGTIL